MLDIAVHDHLSREASEEWRAFLASSPHAHPRQDPRFAEVERAIGAQPLFAVGRRNGAMVAAGLFSIRRRRGLFGAMAEALALSGPVCDSAETMREFLDRTVADRAFKAVDVVRVTPYWLDRDARELAAALDGGGWGSSEDEPFRATGLIDLTPSEEVLRASFSRSARRKVRLAEKADIEVRALATPAEAKIFFGKLNRMLGSRSLSTVPEAESARAFDCIFSDPSAGVLLGAYAQGELLGGYLSYRSWHTAHGRRYFADPGALQVLSNLRVAPILWLEGMLWAKRQGCTTLDVEGWRDVTDKSDPHFNVYEYKGEFNPTATVRIGERSRVLNSFAHALDATPRRLKATARKRFPDLARRITGR